jgi:hypothetical protein
MMKREFSVAVRRCQRWPSGTVMPTYKQSVLLKQLADAKEA